MKAFETPSEVDEAMAWPQGRAEKLARRGFVPHYRLPDGAIRFRMEEVLATATKVHAPPRCVSCGAVLEAAHGHRACVRCRETRDDESR